VARTSDGGTDKQCQSAPPDLGGLQTRSSAFNAVQGWELEILASLPASLSKPQLGADGK